VPKRETGGSHGGVFGFRGICRPVGLWLFERQDALPEIRDAGMDSPKEVMTDSITFITVIRWRRLSCGSGEAEGFRKKFCRVRGGQGRKSQAGGLHETEAVTVIISDGMEAVRPPSRFSGGKEARLRFSVPGRTGYPVDRRKRKRSMIAPCPCFRLCVNGNQPATAGSRTIL